MSLIKDYIFLNKWINKRRGRLSQLASLLDVKRQTLHTRIFTYRVDQDLMQQIKIQMKKIEVEERQAIDLHNRFKVWIKLGGGRQKALADYLGISTVALRKIGYAKGESKYNLIKYGVQNIRDAMNQIEKNLKDFI
ncbi:hypothetical protein [Acinetobacter calcoaceticus]